MLTKICAIVPILKTEKKKMDSFVVIVIYEGTAKSMIKITHLFE